MRRFLAPLPRCVHLSRAFHTTFPLFAKVIPFKLADIGEGILQVEVLNVCVKPGDTIEEFDRICDVQSDKATVEITSRYAGVVKAVHILRGAVARVGAALIDIEVEEEDTPHPNGSHAIHHTSNGSCTPEVGGNDAPHTQTTPQTNATGTNTNVHAHSKRKNGFLATPATRHMAKEFHIDLSQIQGTGRDGRVMKEDVLAFLESQSAQTSGQATLTHPNARSHATQTTEVSQVEDVEVPIIGIRRVMATTMTEANAIPAFSACEEIDVTSLLTLRTQLREAIHTQRKGTPSSTAQGEVKLSLMPFFLKAISLALRRHPTLNAHVPSGCDRMILKASHHIGVAMDTPGGLLVPVVRDVQLKSLMDLAIEMSELVALGRVNRIGPERLRGGTFTLSNIGTIGATYAVPVLLPPQVVIGATGRVQSLPRFNAAGDVVRAEVMCVSWTADHRVIDGATLVRFGNDFKRYLENPSTMMAEMR